MAYVIQKRSAMTELVHLEYRIDNQNVSTYFKIGPYFTITFYPWLTILKKFPYHYDKI